MSWHNKNLGTSQVPQVPPELTSWLWLLLRDQPTLKWLRLEEAREEFLYTEVGLIPKWYLLCVLSHTSNFSWKILSKGEKGQWSSHCVKHEPPETRPDQNTGNSVIAVIKFYVTCSLVCHARSKLVCWILSISPIASRENQAYSAVTGVMGYSP